MSPRTPEPSYPDWHRYEKLKREWVYTHPEATPREREQAMRLIAQELGI